MIDFTILSRIYGFLLRMLFAICFLVCVFLVCAQTPSTFEDLFPDEALAKGRHFEVTRNELDRAYLFAKIRQQALGIRILGSQRKEIEAQLLDQLIASKLILLQANEADQKEGETFRKEQWSLLLKQLGSEEALGRHILASGVSREYLHNQLYKEGVVKAVLRREVKGKYRVSDSEIRQFYDDNQNAFRKPESIHIQRIFIGRISPRTGSLLSEKVLREKELLIRKLRELALNGEDFAQLAKDYSEDPLTRYRGGEIVIHKGQTKAEFEVPAFALKPGELSEVMIIGAGFHLIKMLAHHPAKRLPIDEVKPNIVRNLETRFIEKNLPDYVAKLKKEAEVTLLSQP